MTVQIERVKAPTRQEFLKNFMHKNKPVILTGVVDQWDAFTKWDPEYLKAVAGDSKITVHYREDGSFFEWYVDLPNRVDVEMKFGEIVDRFANDEASQQYYMTEYDLHLVSQQLRREVDFSAYIDTAKQPWDPQIFIGRNTCMPLHYHGKMEAFLCQLRGEKRIVLYSPEQYASLYPGEWYKPIPLFSRIDGRKILEGKVDLERFPKFKDATPLEFTLHPGEMLFIPLHWWHLTAVSGYQLSVTAFFRTKWRCWTFPTPGLQTLGREIVDRLRSMRDKISGGRNQRRQGREA